MPVPDSAVFAAIVPEPVRAAGLVRVMPPASVSVPPSILMVPLVADCGALMVRLPADPISSVWLVLLSAIAAAEVAEPSIFRVLAAAELIVSTTPLEIGPKTSRVPVPLAVIVPVPVIPPVAATMPRPLSVVPAASASPPESL